MSIHSFRPVGTREEYLKIWEISKNFDHSKSLEDIETYFGKLYNKEYIDNLALFTQICKKGKKLTYVHGYLIMSALMKYLDETNLDNITILETGTARGFSSVCMAKILDEYNVEGKIHTLDIISKSKRMFWNCISDSEGPKTRKELLSSWEDLVNNHIVFHEGDSIKVMPKLGLDRIHFAFLDGHHEYKHVLMELLYLRSRQQKGDVIICDDYTKGQYDGIVRAIDDFLNTGEYEYRLFYADNTDFIRGYMYMVKK